MGVGDVLEQAGLELPEGLGSGAGGFIQAFLFLLILSFLVGGIVWYVTSKKQYNKHIHIFEEINGKAVPTSLDKAKEILLPNTSIRAYYLRKKKVFLPRPSIQTGIGHYWFFIRNDGEWINVGLENLNTKLNELKIHYDHTDMRMANAALKKLIEKNYKKLNWVKEFAPYIALGILILLLSVAAFLVINQANKATSALATTAETNKLVLEGLLDVLQSMDRITTGSGIKAAGT